jgi:hypothetical protein
MVQDQGMPRWSMRIGRGVQLRQHGELIAPVEGDLLVHVSVGPSGEAICLWTSSEGQRAIRASEEVPGFASFPVATADHPVTVRLVSQWPRPGEVVTVEGFELGFPKAQPLPGNRFLLVGTRCEWRPTGPDQNAIVVDGSGSVIVSTTFGDGIAHVLASPNGQVWVGYFDEGIFGNYGWGEPDSAPCPGASGLVRYGLDLEPAWSYPTGSPLGPIYDCYALGLNGEDSWTCYYDAFPVVRVRDGIVEGWRSEVDGPRAVVTDGSTAVLIGGYGRDALRLVRGSLDGGHFEKRSISRLALPKGADPRRTSMHSRDEELHVFVGTTWLKASLSDLSL